MTQRGQWGRDLVAFVDEALVPEPLEHPPRRLDVGVVVGDVGVLHVQPDAGAVGHGLPLADVAEDALAAAAVELLDAELLDLLLAGDAELLLDLQLDGQTVGIPSAAAQGPEPAHRLVAEDDVLERAGEHMVDARAAVRRRRPLVEDEQGGIRADAVDPVRQVGLSPRFEDRGLQLWEVHLAGDGFIPFLRVASHSPPFCKRKRPSAHRRTDVAVVPPPFPCASGARALCNLAPRTDAGGRPAAVTGGPPVRAYLLRGERSGGGSGGIFGRSRAPAHTVPGSLCARWSAYSSPSQPVVR